MSTVNLSIVKIEKEDEVKPSICQKDYLKKYLSGPDTEKKKKKKKGSKISSSTHLKRSVIIDDDDPGVKDVNDDDEIILVGEEAPQIVGVVDERTRFAKDRWKVLNEGEGIKMLKEKNSNISKNISKHSDSDASPPRFSDQNFISKTKDSDSDLSPPRKSSKHHRNSDSDLSPPRKNKHRSNSKNYDSDLSPPRKSKPGDRRSRHDSDSRSQRKRKSRGSDSDLSPPRKSDKNKNKSHKHDSDSDLSPPRRSGDKPQSSGVSFKMKNGKRSKNENTLEGKKAGLQKAKNLKEELRILKEKEDKMFRKMDPRLLGKSATTIIRDRRTGLKRNLEKEEEEGRKKNELLAARQEKYDRWGKGLKQVREQQDKVADAIHEMAKPLARYKDDEDLERLLKAREREGDPMLDYIRQQQKEAHQVDITGPEDDRPSYKGHFMPNRFGIPPGHRWDGVDRSNEYEKKWFESRNAKTATGEEAYKWSTSDM